MRNLLSQHHAVGERFIAVHVRDIADLQDELTLPGKRIGGLGLNLLEDEIAAGVHCGVDIAKGLITSAGNDAQIGIELG